MLGPIQGKYRCNCNGAEVRLSVHPAGSWITIRRRGSKDRGFDVPSHQVQAVLSAFPQKGDSPIKIPAKPKSNAAGYKTALTA